MQQISVHNLVFQKLNDESSCILQIQVLQYLHGVNFTMHSGENVFFDQDGDPAARYELVNWQKNEAKDTVFVTVGEYDATLPEGKQFAMNNVNIVWAGDNYSVGTITDWTCQSTKFYTVCLTFPPATFFFLVGFYQFRHA